MTAHGYGSDLSVCRGGRDARNPVAAVAGRIRAAFAVGVGGGIRGGDHCHVRPACFLHPNAEFLLKALGIAVLTQCCAELCRESGESGVANGVELAGKVEILLLALPLIAEILSTARELLSLAS